VWTFPSTLSSLMMTSFLDRMLHAKYTSSIYLGMWVNWDSAIAPYIWNGPDMMLSCNRYLPANQISFEGWVALGGTGCGQMRWQNTYTEYRRGLQNTDMLIIWLVAPMLESRQRCGVNMNMTCGCSMRKVDMCFDSALISIHWCAASHLVNYNQENIEFSARSQQ